MSDSLFYWPSSAERWWNVVALSAGALAAWAVSPSLWPCGPFGWVRRVVSTAAQESGFSSTAQGDTEINPGPSVGILQYNYAKADWYFDGWRESPFMSGWATQRYWRDAGLLEWKIWLWCPFLGAAVFRWGWGRGTGNPPDLVGAWDRFWDEQFHSAGGYRAALLVTSVPTLLLSWWILVLVGGGGMAWRRLRRVFRG